MTDQPDEHGPVDDMDHVDHVDDVVDEMPDEGHRRVAPVTTGHPAVDEVLRSLEGLDGRPVDEHVAAFEEAHEVLRRALSHAGDDTVPPSGA